MSQLLYLDRYLTQAKPVQDTASDESTVSWNDAPLSGGDDFYVDSESGTGNLQALENSDSDWSGSDDADLLGALDNAETEDAGKTESDEESADGEYTTKNGVRYYSSKDPETGPGYDFSLSATGDKTRSVVTTDGAVSIAIPEGMSAKLSQQGDTLTLKIKDETIEIDLKQASALTLSGKLEGEIDDPDHKISTDQGLYVSSAKRDAVKQTLSGLSDKIGTTIEVSKLEAGYLQIGDTYNANGIYGNVVGSDSGVPSMGGTAPGSRSGNYIIAPQAYCIGDQNIRFDSAATKVVDTAKQFFGLMSQAFQESDPKKQKTLWQDASDLLVDYSAQDPDGGQTNNLGHLIGNALLGEFGGKEELLELFNLGIIPSSIATTLSQTLRASPAETSQINDVHDYQHGGPGEAITHGQMANIFDQAKAGNYES